jgi:hypothetical protein
LVLALSSLLLIAASPQTAVEAERDFAARAQTEGMWTAFRATAAPGAIMFVPQQVGAHDFLKDRKDPLLGYMWWPAEAFVSCDGNTAVTTGPSVLGGSRGYFTTAWQKQPDGEWKWLLDHGDTLTKPRNAPEQPKLLTASCTKTPGQRPIVVPVGGGAGFSDDGTLVWIWHVNTNGGRTLTVYLWDGNEYDRVIEDKVDSTAP